MDNGIDAVIGVLSVLLPLAAALFTKRKPRFKWLEGDSAKQAITSTPQVSCSSLVMTQESQGTAIRLLTEQVEQLRHDVRRRFDELLIALTEFRGDQNKRLDKLEEAVNSQDERIATLTRRVYALEHPVAEPETGGG